MDVRGTCKNNNRLVHQTDVGAALEKIGARWMVSEKLFVLLQA